MAFNMKRPIIKGTPLHKASIAKATEKSIVAPAEVGADPSLVESGYTLGKSYIPKAIDYSIKSPKHKFKKKKKEEEERDKSDDVEALTITPRGYKQPEKKREEELKKATRQAPDSGESTDRFMDAAEEFGYDMSTVKGQEEAEATMEYDDKSDKWINPRVEVGGVASDQQMLESAKNYGITDINDMVPDGKGGYVPKEGAKHHKDGDTWDAEAGGWRDDAGEQYYGPEGQKITKETSDKLAISQEKKLDKYKRNENIKDAKEYYGPDVKLTQTKLDEYNNMIQGQDEFLEIEEESDPEIGEPGYEKFIEEQKQQEFIQKDENNNNIPDYLERQEIGPMQKRDDRIWNGAIKGGKVHENMRKSGYVPRNER